MRRLLQPLRFLTTFFLILAYMAHAFWLSLWVGRQDPYVLRHHLTRWLKLYSKLGLKILGVQVRVSGRPLQERAQLVVSNHLSYLDVLVLSSQKAGCFVTSQDIRQTPFLGQIVELAGCLFVDRRSRENLAQEISQLTEALQAGLSVMVFPEATSTNGESVLRFRRPLFNAAILSAQPVQPLCLNYQELGGEPVNTVNRDSVFWYGDMPFASHLWALSGLGKIVVEVCVLDPINPILAREFGGERPDQWLAEKSYQEVVEAFQPVGREPVESIEKRPEALRRPPELSE